MSRNNQEQGDLFDQLYAQISGQQNQEASPAASVQQVASAGKECAKGPHNDTYDKKITSEVEK